MDQSLFNGGLGVATLIIWWLTEINLPNLYDPAWISNVAIWGVLLIWDKGGGNVIFIEGGNTICMVANTLIVAPQDFWDNDTSKKYVLQVAMTIGITECLPFILVEFKELLFLKYNQLLLFGIMMLQRNMITLACLLK